MKAVYIQRGESIEYKNTTSNLIAVGDVVTLDKRIGIAGYNIPAGATGTVHLQGVYELDAETSAAFNVGQTVYLATDKVSATTGDVVAGIVVAPKASTGTKARIKIG